MNQFRKYRIISLVLVICIIALSECYKKRNEMPIIEYNDLSNNKKTKVEEVPVQPYKEAEGVSKDILFGELDEVLKFENAFNEKQEKFSVAIIDSGIYPHEMLKERLIVSEDFIANRELAYDDLGHGTAVAGIISSISDAQLISLKVITSMDTVDTKDLIEALNWIEDHYQEYHIKVVNISIGVGLNEKSDELYTLCKRLVSKGMFIIASAGNKDGYSERFLPADCEDVISVGSLGYDQERYISAFSMSWLGENNHVIPTIYSYGENIETLDSYCLYKGTENETRISVETKHFENGTSFASAVVSGIVCRFIEEHPLYSVDEIKQELLSGEKIYDESIQAEIPMTVY